MYVDTETMSVEDHFPAKNIFFVNYNKISTPGTVPKHWIGFSYIRSEEYELYQKFDDTELKNNQTTHQTIKFKTSRKYCVPLGRMV